MRRSFLLIALILLLPAISTAQNQNSIEGDFIALQEFYNAMNGSNWDNNNGWENMTPETMGAAFGVVVYTDGTNAGRVKELNLSGYPIGRDNRGRVQSGAPIGNNLSGNSIPDSFGNLKQMTHLRLKGNNITATLSNWLPNLKGAIWISLNGSKSYGGQDEVYLEDYSHYNHGSKSWNSHNKFEGNLPDFSNLENLEMLELMSTNLSGGLPDELPPNIKGLFLSNSYLSDELPPAWGNASKLTHLYMSNRDGGDHGKSNHYGELPPEWDGMKEMRWFYMDGNNLAGPIPEYRSWYDLRYFGLGVNGEIETEFPEWLFDDPNKHNSLHTLNLGALSNFGDKSGIYGVLPINRSNNSSLYVFAVADNNIEGELPAWTANSSITQYNVRDNRLSGTFPDMSTKRNLRWIRAENNEFTGSLPEVEPTHGNFQELRFQNNQFSGDIPESYGLISDAAFSNLYLQNNLLDGMIPNGIFGNGWNIRLENNKYTPKNLVPILNQNLNKVSYLPQKPFGETETVPVGNIIDRSSFHYSGNRYQWYKDGNTVNGETSHSINTSLYGTGTYVLEITHPDINYTFESEPIEVTADGGGSTDEPTAPATPSLQSPSNGASNVTVNPNFSWSSVSADSYTLRVYTSGGSLVFENTGSSTGYTTPSGRTLDYDTEYSWRVRATRDGLSSDWSSSRSFTTESVEEPAAPSVPSLQSPSNGATNVSVNPDFSWSSDNADSYTLQVNNSGGSLVFENTDSGTSYSIPTGRTLAHNTEYSWRVRATRDGLNSDWSSSRSFTTESDDDGSGPGPSDPDGDVLPAPDVQSPVDGATDVSLTPTLEWSKIDGADSYILHLSATNPSEMVIEETLEGTNFSPEAPLVAERNHQWRVRAVKDGVEGEWSAIAEFTTQSEDGGNRNNGKAPRKATPAKDEKNVKKNATFTWESVEGAESYTIEIRESSTSSLFVEEEVTDTVYVTNQRMKGNTEYTWRVRATIEGLPGEWSDEWGFTTEDENEENAFVVELDQNYPNPFNPSTNIRFTLSETQEVSLKVYDMAGRLVASLVDGSTFTAGTHSASFNAQSLASGIYFYRLITPGEIVTRKMTLMK